MATKIEKELLIRSSRERQLNHISAISRGLCTTAYATIMFQRLEEKGLVEFKKKDRRKIVIVTKKGRNKIREWGK